MHAPLSQQRHDTWSKFAQWDVEYFPRLVGLTLEEVRTDYCRMRLPWRVEITQPHGIGHGGAIATLIDSVVVPAIGSGYDENRKFSTVNMNINYMAALHEEDAVAEGWIVRRGRSMVFCQVEVTGAASTKLLATASLSYMLLN